MSTTIEYDFNLIYFLLKTILAFASLVSTLLKVPIIVFAINLIINFVNRRRTGDPDNKPADDSGKEQVTLPLFTITLNILFMIVLFIAVLAVLIRTTYRLLKKGNSSAYSYLVIMGIWILFILVSILTEGWSGPLNYAMLFSKSLLTGWFAVDAPSHWQFILLRISIVIDVIAYPAMVGIAILDRKYSFHKEEKVGIWDKYASLVRKV